MDQFEKVYEKFKSEGKNSVDSIIEWMKEIKLIDATKEAEEKARKLFADVKDAKDVELEKFKEAMEKIAEEHKKTVSELTKTLTEQGPKLVSALMAGASAFKDAFNKK